MQACPEPCSPAQAQAQAKAAAAGIVQPAAPAPKLGLSLGAPGLLPLVRPAAPAQRHTLRVDEQGREIDEHGRVVQRAIQAASTLKVLVLPSCWLRATLAPADTQLLCAGQPEEGPAKGRWLCTRTRAFQSCKVRLLRVTPVTRLLSCSAHLACCAQLRGPLHRRQRGEEAGAPQAHRLRVRAAGAPAAAG